MTAASAELDLTVEAEWARLHDQLELAEGYWLGWVFTPRREVAQTLSERVGEKLRALGRRLRRWECATPDELARARNDLIGASEEGGADCLWVEATAPLDGSWREAWSTFLLRTNEQRDRLQRKHRGGVVIAGPPSLKALAKELGPDLWAIRSLVVDVPLFSGAVAVSLPPVGRDWLDHRLIAPVPPPRSSVDASLRDAERALHRARRFMEAVRAVLAAVRALNDAGRTGEARALIERLLRLPRWQSKQERIWYAHTLVALAHADDVDRDYVAARVHLREAVDTSPDSDDPSVLHWLWRLSELAISQGDPQEALGAATRACALSEEKLKRSRGAAGPIREHFESLRHLASILMDMGLAARAHPVLLDAVREWKSLAEAGLDASSTASDGADVLGRFSECERHLGMTEESLRHARDAVSYARQVFRRETGGTTSTIKLATALAVLAAAHQNVGEWSDAIQHLRESIDLLDGAVPDDPLREPSRLRAVVRFRLGEALQGSGDLDAAIEQTARAVAELDTELGSIAGMASALWLLQTLQTGRKQLGALLQARGDLDAARAEFTKSLTLSRQLFSAWKGRARNRQSLRDALDQLATIYQADGRPDLATPLRAEAAGLALSEPTNHDRARTDAVEPQPSNTK